MKVRALTAPSGSALEAVIPVPGTRGVQALFDMGAHPVGGAGCRDASASSPSFTDLVFTVDRAEGPTPPRR